jgi:hypothetical protein
MEQKFSNNSIDRQVLREFCEREGEEIAYCKGDQLERECVPALWFAFVAERRFRSPFMDYLFAWLNFFSLSQTPRCFSGISLGFAST